MGRFLQEPVRGSSWLTTPSLWRNDSVPESSDSIASMEESSSNEISGKGNVLQEPVLGSYLLAPAPVPNQIEPLASAATTSMDLWPRPSLDVNCLKEPVDRL